MSRTQSHSVQQAIEILKGAETATYAELDALSRALRRENQLGYARRLLEKAVDIKTDATQEKQLGLVRDLVLCTYKDPDLPVDTRLRNAEAMLNTLLGEPVVTGSEELFDSRFGRFAEALTTYPKLKQDLLGIAGAVQKRRWEVYGGRRHLVTAYEYYRRGYDMGADRDLGYTGINLAFVLDLLSEQDEAEFGDDTRRKMAVQVRSEIVKVLNAVVHDQPAKLDDWWVLCTMGEAYLGLGEYQTAAQWMAKASDLRKQLERDPDGNKRVAPWQLEATARQIAHLARIQVRRDAITLDALFDSEPWSVVKALLGGESVAAASFLLGKVGLALSGGGFRASLFHIGVLARLAELDVLRHVEVLSCVSGGSILGAYYYLELRHLLQTQTDGKITREGYIELVRRMRENFLKGVQRNIRLRMLMGWPSNWKVLTSCRSSSSDRLADLYERELYSRVADGEEGQPRYLADLTVSPKEESTHQDGTDTKNADFNPKYDNWKRLNKVPALILNATSLNTCHNWQFTASFMGEPPARVIDAEIDANDRLRRMYHSEAPGRYLRDPETNPNGGVRLGEAVAASACVPGLFDPIVLEELYGMTGEKTSRFLTRLVDGGNYDNQGIASLREQDCTVLLVSDASGQTGVSEIPSGGHLTVMQRANNILMARVREAQYQLLASLRDAGTLQGVFFIHLKKGLQAPTVDWVNCEDPSDFEEPPVETEYGIRYDVQRLLAAVRTDLDSFSWLEADALMLSGYRMTAVEWAKCLANFPVSHEQPAAWEFQKLCGIATAENGTQALKSEIEQLKKGLTVASKLAFKPLSLSRALWVGAMIPLILLAGWIVWSVVAHWSAGVVLPNAGRCIAIVFGVILALVLIKELLLDKMLDYRNGYGEILAALVMCIVGWILFYPYLWLIDPFYVRWGSAYRNRTLRTQPPDKTRPPARTAASSA
jgi:predicted acylesterase/phospholipase RssA